MFAVRVKGFDAPPTLQIIYATTLLFMRSLTFLTDVLVIHLSKIAMVGNPFNIPQMSNY
jgi:hypothetical protein